MVEVLVRPARAEDYDAVAEIDQQSSWPTLSSETAYAEVLQEYTVAVVNGQVWGFLQGSHDSQAWAQCLMVPQPPPEWTCSFVHFFAVHERARGHGLGAGLLRDFMDRSRAAGSAWMMLHPAECGDVDSLPPAVRRLCSHAGLRLVEPKAVHRRARPGLMAAPLTDTPAYGFRPVSHAPAARGPVRGARPFTATAGGGR